MTEPNPQPLAFVGVKMAAPLAAALRETAAARGVTLSAVMRDALAKELASVPTGGRRPATPEVR